MFKEIEIQFDKEIFQIFETEELASNNLFKTAYSQTPHSLKIKVINSIIDLKMNQFLAGRWVSIQERSRVMTKNKKGNDLKNLVLTDLAFSMDNIVNMFMQKP